MKLDPKRLTVLAAAIRSGSMSRAALELGYSTAAVSQHIGALEREVGAALLVRHARGVRATPAGALLAAHAHAIDDRLAEAQRDLANLLRADRATIRAGLFTSAWVGALPAALSALRRTHADVHVEVSEIDADIAADRLRAGELDLAILFDDPDEPTLDRSDLELTSLGHDPMLVMLPATHRNASLVPVPLADLARERWILPHGADCAALIRRRCLAAGFEPTIALETDDYVAARSLVAGGMGVATVPGLMRQQDSADVVVRPLHPSPERELLVATHASHTTPATAALRRAFLHTSAAR